MVCESRKRKKRESTFGTYLYWRNIYASMRKGAKKKSIYFDFSMRDLKDLYASSKVCFYCHQPQKAGIAWYKSNLKRKGILPSLLTSKRLSLERLEPEKGYIKGNVVLADGIPKVV